MEWIFAHRGDILVLSMLAALTVVITVNLLKKKSTCGSCGSCSGGCKGCGK